MTELSNAFIALIYIQGLYACFSSTIAAVRGQQDIKASQDNNHENIATVPTDFELYRFTLLFWKEHILKKLEVSNQIVP